MSETAALLAALEASEPCFNYSEHLEQVTKRLATIAALQTPKDELELEVRTSVSQEMFYKGFAALSAKNQLLRNPVVETTWCGTSEKAGCKFRTEYCGCCAKTPLRSMLKSRLPDFAPIDSQFEHGRMRIDLQRERVVKVHNKAPTMWRFRERCTLQLRSASAWLICFTRVVTKDKDCTTILGKTLEIEMELAPGNLARIKTPDDAEKLSSQLARIWIDLGMRVRVDSVGNPLPVSSPRAPIGAAAKQVDDEEDVAAKRRRTQ